MRRRIKSEYRVLPKQKHHPKTTLVEGLVPLFSSQASTHDVIDATATSAA
jgi:hypothetical protein